MKKMMLFIVILLAISCTRNMPDNRTNEQKTIEWIQSHPKPIACAKIETYDNIVVYTLSDSLGAMYCSDRCLLKLPDTIYSIGYKLAEPKQYDRPHIDYPGFNW